jgi:hypothetical protein
MLNPYGGPMLNLHAAVPNPDKAIPFKDKSSQGSGPIESSVEEPYRREGSAERENVDE